MSDTEHTECAVCGYEPDPDRVPPHYVLSLSDNDIDDEYVQSYPFGGSLSVPFACSDECWLDAQDDPELIADGGMVQCCPECDSVDLRLVSSSSMQSHSDGRVPRYRCRGCDARFDEPDERKSKNPHASGSGLAYRLEQADSLDELREGSV